MSIPGRFQTCRIGLSACVLMLLPLTLRAQELRLAPQQGVLVLRTGSTISGMITHVGDRYYVALPDDAEIRVRAAEVELWCRDLDEAYRRKRAALDARRADDHLALAEWCLRQDLLGYAAREIVSAQLIEPGHPRTELIERRLRVAMAPPEEPAPESDALSDRIPADELDSLVRGLPAGTVEAFTASVQPLLLNCCSTAACHGAGSENRLQLERITTGRPPTRRLTQRNLRSVLECVDRENPAASPLLTLPIGPHGTAETPVFTDRDLEKYQQLVLWVNSLEQRAPPQQPSSINPPAAQLLQTMGGTRAAFPRATPLGSKSLPADSAGRLPSGQKAGADALRNPASESELDSAAAPEVAEDGGLDARRSVQRGAPAPEPLAKDPFDPAIFNRQFFGDER